MTKDEVLADIRHCLKAADRADASEDLSSEDSVRALIGFALREVAEHARPYVAPTKLAMDMLSKYRAKG
mgnify:CR=1 FL=1